MTPKALAQKISGFPALLRGTIELERALRTRGTWGCDPLWYTSQKEHWLGWLSGYSGPGAYRRKDWNRTAEFVYNHIVCPPMVLWLGEATGIAKSKVDSAKRAALSAGSRLPAQCAAIRKVITWDMIEVQLTIQKKQYRRNTKRRRVADLHTPSIE
jgi:hypothetical protein